jgi:5S rRNA maturation endonuclease (ribonuclease M5)
MSEARQVIFDEIVGKVHGSKKLTGDSYMIQCPYHEDSTPSGGINLTVDTDVPLGYYHCFGCGEKRRWNELAETLGLHKFKDWELGFSGNGSRKDQRKKKIVEYETITQELRRSLNTMELIDWPAIMSWRGYKGQLIKRLGGLFYNDPMTDEIMLFFPITINNKFKGGVRAYLEKQVNGLSYLTTKGPWVKDCGILGYEYIKKIIRRNGYTALVIVEGPRDMLRLIDNKIPAVAILGSENFTRKKLMRILGMSSKIDTLYVMPDNDKAGASMYYKIKGITGDYAKVKHLKLPREKNKEGKLIKMDPDDAPQHFIDEVKKVLNKHRESRV